VKRSERKEGKESVWEYPRPPRVEPSNRHVRVVFNGETIADSREALRVLEKSHPPIYYIPPGDAMLQCLVPTGKRTTCEFKGVATYYSVQVKGRVSENAAWSYHHPNAGYESIKDHIAYYPGRVDGCYVDGERVQAQEGDFYGGWITADVVGPFKGGLGTSNW